MASNEVMTEQNQVDSPRPFPNKNCVCLPLNYGDDRLKHSALPEIDYKKIVIVPPDYTRLPTSDRKGKTWVGF